MAGAVLDVETSWIAFRAGSLCAFDAAIVLGGAWEARPILRGEHADIDAGFAE